MSSPSFGSLGSVPGLSTFVAPASSDKPVTQREFDQLSKRVDDLSRQVAALQSAGGDDDDDDLAGGGPASDALANANSNTSA